MKITRDAFLYLDGAGPGFAQCGSCVFGYSRCAIMSDLKVSSQDGACGFYIKSYTTVPTQIRPIANLTKEQTGYVERQVRCENCAFFDQTCGLYEQLNKLDEFDLDPNVKPRGCCNAQVPK